MTLAGELASFAVWADTYLRTIGDDAVMPGAMPRNSMRAGLPQTPPRAGSTIAATHECFLRHILPAVGHWNHPRFFGYFNSSTCDGAIAGELVASVLNTNCMTWRASPGGVELEEHVVDWLRQIVGLPESFSGLLFDGGSTTTLHALAAARHAAEPESRVEGLKHRHLTLYATEMTHSSVAKAAVTLGLGTASIRNVPVDERFRMRADALELAVRADRAAGRQPFCVIATVGSTSTTSIDPIDAVAGVCRRESLWLHVDAAHGGGAAAVPEARPLFAGWERADSITINPHKWMFVPLGCSILLTSRPDDLRDAFAIVPEYLRAPDGTEEPELMDLGVPLGRRFRALVLWYAITTLGTDALIARVREHLALARELAGLIQTSDDFELLAPVPLSTVCFRASSLDDAGNLELLERLNSSGVAFLTHTRINGVFALRLTISSYRTSRQDVLKTWSQLRTLAAGFHHS
ncbi:MAG TPA: pyridoxal-dependent decarboxylase [Thermoanaerobaculia bacterium]|nr:pyridoxal-dependent decarboxylase [Thermoanaerobaculia bacterium]